MCMKQASLKNFNEKKLNQNKLLERRLTLLEANDKRIEEIINRVEKDVQDIRDKHITKIHIRLDTIEDKLLNRVPGWAVIIIAFLSSLSVALITYVLAKL